MARKRSTFDGVVLLGPDSITEWQSSDDFEWANKVGLGTFYLQDWTAIDHFEVKEFIRSMIPNSMTSEIAGDRINLKPALFAEMFGLREYGTKVRRVKSTCRAHINLVQEIVDGQELSHDSHDGYPVDKLTGKWPIRCKAMVSTFGFKRRNRCISAGLLEALARADKEEEIDWAELFWRNVTRELTQLQAKIVPTSTIGPLLTMVLRRVCGRWERVNRPTNLQNQLVEQQESPTTKHVKEPTQATPTQQIPIQPYEEGDAKLQQEDCQASHGTQLPPSRQHLNSLIAMHETMGKLSSFFPVIDQAIRRAEEWEQYEAQRQEMKQHYKVVRAHVTILEGELEEKENSLEQMRERIRADSEQLSKLREERNTLRVVNQRLLDAARTKRNALQNAEANAKRWKRRACQHLKESQAHLQQVQESQRCSEDRLKDETAEVHRKNEVQAREYQKLLQDHAILKGEHHLCSADTTVPLDKVKVEIRTMVMDECQGYRRTNEELTEQLHTIEELDHDDDELHFIIEEHNDVNMAAAAKIENFANESETDHDDTELHLIIDEYQQRQHGCSKNRRLSEESIQENLEGSRAADSSQRGRG